MKKKISLLMIFLGFVMIEGCTDLEEDVLDEAATFGANDKQVAEGLLAPVYGRLTDLFNHTNYFNVQEISTDEAILPYRGGTDWGDNGIYIAMHTHNFSNTDPNLANTWSFIMQGVFRASYAIETLATLNDPVVKTYMAESRAMRAFYNMLSLDLFGLAFVKENLLATTPTLTKILRGAEAVDFIKSDLLAAEPDLDNSTGPGRVTQAAVWGLLAKLHLNAPVYRDVYADQFNFSADDMDKVISYCDKIIALGKYQLSPDYFAIFGNNNHDNKELIFALDQRADLFSHNRLAYFSLSSDQFPNAIYPAANGTDGPAITPDFYRTWVDAYGSTDPAAADPRFYKKNLVIPADSCVTAAQYNIDRGILRGQQYGLIRVNGAFVRCSNGNYRISKLKNLVKQKPNLPVVFTEQVDYTAAGSNYSTGYRVEKYEFSKVSEGGRTNGEADISFIRLADIYLMRAEAKLRRSNDVAGALADVNTVRASRTASAPPPALADMNLELLFRERGFEFYWEMCRRTDMIRFSKYEGKWTEKTDNNKLRRIFPIPQTAIDGASNVPGYLVQNQGY